MRVPLYQRLKREIKAILFALGKMDTLSYSSFSSFYKERRRVLFYLDCMEGVIPSSPTDYPYILCISENGMPNVPPLDDDNAYADYRDLMNLHPKIGSHEVRNSE